MPISPTFLHKKGHSLLCCCRCRGSAGSVLRSQGSLGEEELSRCALGMGLIAANARSGPIPLRCGFMGLRGNGPTLAE